MSQKVSEVGVHPLSGNGQAGAVTSEDPFYIAAPAPLAGERERVLKQGDTFAVFDHHGDIRPVGMREQGLFHEGTRFLSCLILRLGRNEPLFLSSTVKEDNAVLTVDLTNADVREGDHIALCRGTVHLSRNILLWQGACYQQITLRNYGMAPVEASFSLRFEADFADIFEVRGTQRPRRGRLLAPRVGVGEVVLSYEGLDHIVRRARLEFAPTPARLSSTEAHFNASLRPQAEAVFHVSVSCDAGGKSPSHPVGYDIALARTTEYLRGVRAQTCDVCTDNERFNDWLVHSLADLDMMATQTPEGLYPYAGVPWFSTPFGRDGIITALQCLWVNPDMARGVLAYLAATQAEAVDPAADAEPGKILHETRRGEMVALREVPFGRYYGSVDSTPLFVLLASAYYERTADLPFLRSIWPNVERALHWIEDSGDADGDGFIEYARQSADGLTQQGWKDSHDSVFHADGTLAAGPIALCEVQGYVYAAKRGAATLAAAIGQPHRAAELERAAEALRQRFEAAFWCEDLSTYALALDGDKRPCRVRTSNPGHCLYTGIVTPERAAHVARTLLDDASFSGWGIRTVAEGEARYNPMSYHDGSVWPHDNSLIGAGLARYRLKEAALRVLTGMFDASQFVELQRMPELFCGFPRRPGVGPTLYPVACSPQAWAAGAVFLLVEACLGLHINAQAAQVSLDYPLLPQWLHEVRIRNLRVGSATLDLRLHRHGDDVGVNVLGRSGRVEVLVVK
jgi:glycogen debranching enzyme